MLGSESRTVLILSVVVRVVGEKRAGPEEHDMSTALRNELRESLAPWQTRRSAGEDRMTTISARRLSAAEKMGQPGDQKLTQITTDEELR